MDLAKRWSKIPGRVRQKTISEEDLAILRGVPGAAAVLDAKLSLVDALVKDTKEWQARIGDARMPRRDAAASREELLLAERWREMMTSYEDLPAKEVTALESVPGFESFRTNRAKSGEERLRD